MISPGTVIASVLPVYLLMIAGAGLRKLGVIRKEHDAGIMQVVFGVMISGDRLRCEIFTPLARTSPSAGGASGDARRTDGDHAGETFRRQAGGGRADHHFHHRPQHADSAMDHRLGL